MPESRGSDRAPHPPGKAPAPAETWLDRTVRTYAEEPLLWPVLVSGLLIFATFGSVILLLAREGRLAALAALLLLIFVTVRAIDADVRRRRLGPGGWLILGLWGASLLVAGGLAWLGVF